MNIGEAAQLSGVTSKMIRHYEDIGIMPKASRSMSGYRTYSEKDIHILRFVKKARSLGFNMKDIKQLVGLWKNKSRTSSDVKRLTQKHIQELETKIEELQLMVKSLKTLSHHCHGDNRPDCPILDDLSVP